MLKENWRSIARIQKVGDLLITIVAFFLAYYARAALLYWNQRLEWNLPFEAPSLAPISDYSFILILALISSSATLHLQGAYSSMRLSSSWQLLRMFMVASAFVFITIAASLFIFKIDISRSFVILFCLIMVLAISAERFVVLEFLRYWRRRGFNFRNVIVCGTGPQCLRLASEISKKPELGIRIRAFSDLRGLDQISSDFVQTFKAGLKQRGVDRTGRILFGEQAFTTALNDYAIDEVLFTDIVQVMPQVEKMLLVCAEQGVRTTLAADLFSIGMVKSGLSYFGEMPLIHYQTPPGDRWELGVKRLLDFVVAGTLLILLAPVLLVIALLVKTTSAGPVIFVQRRVGLNGRLFEMYKFRSMNADAEKDFAGLKAQNEMQGPAFKIKQDPRVTGVGKFLRRYSLDELPQLWNVLIGDMSLVGPRPPVPGEVSEYERYYRRRLSMRPGLTCTWQVSGRNEIQDFESWVKLDLEYIDNWSLGRDFILLLRTLPAVLFGHGAR